MSELFERDAILSGAVTAFLTSAFGLLVALAFRWVFGWERSGVSALATAFVVGGCILGAFRAGLGAPRSPLSNGAAASVLAGVAISVTQRLIAGKGVRPVSLLFVAALCACLGVFGGFVANNANRTRAMRRD
jgi:putative membrane protein (TIGR04086 family)